MEHDGLVSRTEVPAHPPHVEYALTDLGRSLLIPLRAVREWAEHHVPDSERAGRGRTRTPDAARRPTGHPGPSPSPPGHAPSSPLPPRRDSCETVRPVRSADSFRNVPHEKCAVRSLPLPLALTARLAPVAVLATAGWALSSGPDTSPAAHDKTPEPTPSASASAPATEAATKTYAASPAPCEALAAKTVTSLVPGAKAAGKEIPSTDRSVRRTCSWNALKGYDYRWLDVSFEVMRSDDAARTSYRERVADRSGGGAVPGLGDEAYSVVNLTTEDKQQTREGTVLVRSANALVMITYNGSDFESKKAPSTDEINKGAIRAAREAVAALTDSQG